MNDIIEQSDFLFYRADDGKTTIRVITSGETVWMTQKSMGELFTVDRSVITKHLQNVFEEKELSEDSVCAVFAHTADDGKNYKTRFYNLDAIIAVGYRVNSYNATQFRIWATKILREYLVKGFAMDDERLKQGKTLFGKDYFEELLDRIREIRRSERRFYEKITDLYALSADYDPQAPITQLFFSTVQNKLEFAITHMTAPEIIRKRADAKKPYMGLTNWKNQGSGGKISKYDTGIAKNYLDKNELEELNLIVSMYLDQAELFAKRHKLMKMSDWIERLDAFLKFNEYDVLKNAGSIRASVAKQFAASQYEKFRLIQDKEYKSDFDKFSEAARANKLPKEEDVITDVDSTKKETGMNLILKGMLSVPPPRKDKQNDEEKEGAE